LLATTKGLVPPKIPFELKIEEIKIMTIRILNRYDKTQGGIYNKNTH